MEGSACHESVTITRTGAEAGVRDGTTRAPCSALGQDDDSQLDALRATASRGTRSSARRSAPASAEGPVRGGARTAREVKAHAPHCRVIFTVYEMKRLGRDAAELTVLADHLTAHGLVLEMLAGPPPGIYDPTGPGKLLFAFFAAMAETERENIPESTLEGLDTAARKGKHGGRPPVITADMLHTVFRCRAGGESVEQIQPDLITPTSKRKGHNSSVTSIYRALAEHAKREAYPEAVEAAHADFAALKARDVPAPRTADQSEPTRYLAVLRFEEGGPAVIGEWTDDAPALRTYRGWVGLYGSQDSVVIRLIEVSDGREHVLRGR
ncbi:recombinase family protein [Streptomyces diastaticus]|uniref:recombinase family protein n=1 Tax=Streptomyces TaxID=1883 RepID=UPI0027962A98|nr:MULTISPECIES: recombinase family protein [Streptomyces]